VSNAYSFPGEGVKRAGCEAGHSTQFIAGVSNVCSSSSNIRYCRHVLLRDTFTFA